jgi:hypothetical protein
VSAIGKFRFESCEARRLLAGSVQVSIVDSILTIVGDDRSNSIIIENAGDGSDRFRIQGLDGTRVNGTRGSTFFPRAGLTLDVRLGAGDDSATVTGTRVFGHLQISADAGQDTILVRNTRVAGKLVLDGGEGEDLISVRGSDVSGNLHIPRSPGRDVYSIRNARFWKDAYFHDTNGSVRVSVIECYFAGFLGIRGGYGRDVITMRDSRTLGKSRFLTGPNDDVIRITGSEFVRPTRLDAGAGENEVHREVIKSFNFDRGAQGWAFDAANYRLSDRRTIEDYQLRGEVRPIEPYEGRARDGYFIRGQNLSDDLFLFIHRMLTDEDGIQSGTTYRLSFDIQIATPVPPNSFGSAEDLYAGSLNRPPEVLPIEDGFDNPSYRLIGNNGNPDYITDSNSLNSLGRVVNDRPRVPGEQTLPYVDVEYEHTIDSDVTVNAAGSLWIIAGIRSGFELGFANYINTILIRLMPIE